MTRRALTPSQLLDQRPVLSINETALVLRMVRRNGEPDRRKVHELIQSGAIRIVDDTQAPWRWTVSAMEIRRYIEHGRRPDPRAVAS